MPRRPAVLLTPLRSTSNSSLFVVLDHEIEEHPLPFESSTQSFAKTPGCHQERFPISCSPLATHLSPVTPLSATLAAEHRVGFQVLYLQTLSWQRPCFSRNRPPTTPLEATLTEISSVTPLSATLTKTPGRGTFRRGKFLRSGSSLRFSGISAPRDQRNRLPRVPANHQRTASSPAAVRRPASIRRSPVLYFLYFPYLLFHPTRHFLFTNRCLPLASRGI